MTERNEAVRGALAHDRVVDVTTRGRKSGEPRRIEIFGAASNNKRLGEEKEKAAEPA